MRSSSSWMDMAKSFSLLTERIMLDYESFIDSEFASMWDSIETELNSFCAKYCRRKGSAYNDSRRMLNVTELKKFLVIVDKWQTETKSMPALTRFNDYCNKLLKRKNISRIEYLQSRLRCIVEFHCYNITRNLSYVLNNVYITQYLLQQYLIMYNTNLPFPLLEVNETMAEEVVRKRWQKSTYMERIYNTKNNVLSLLETIIPRTLAQGLKLLSIKKEVENTFNSFKDNIKSQGRTEANRIHSEAVKDVCKEYDIKTYRYMAPFSESEDCVKMNKKLFTFNGAKVCINLPPLHPGCRSFIMPAMEGHTYKEDGIVINDEKLIDFIKKYASKEQCEFIEDYILFLE